MNESGTTLRAAPDDISAEEWSILAPLLPDHWPDGRPRPWYPPVLEVFRIAGTISLLVTGAAYGLSQFAPDQRIFAGLTALAALLLGIVLIGVPFAMCRFAFRGREATLAPAIENLPDLPPTIAVLNDQFAWLFVAGQGKQADDQAAEACRIAGEGSGAADPVLAEMLYNRATLCVMMEESATAVSLLEQAEGIWLGALEPDSPALADVCSSLATLYRALGDAPCAERLYRRCAEIASGSVEPGSRLVGSSLQSLAELREEAGDPAEAEALYRRVIELLGDRPGAASKRALIAMDKLISLQLVQQNYQAARSVLLRALHATGRDYPDGHPFVADRLDHLGRLYQSMGAFARADPLYARAADIRRRAFGADTPLYTLSLCNRAELTAATGDPSGALEVLGRISAAEDRFVSRAAQRMNERQLMSYISMFYANLCKYLSLVVEHYPAAPFAVTAAFDLVEKRKAAGIEALAARREATLGARDGRLREGLERLPQLRWQIARMSRTGPPVGQGKWDFRHTLARLQSERDDLEAQLARLAPVKESDEAPYDPEMPGAALEVPEGAVLIEFVRFHVFRFGAVPARGEARWGPPRYVAFVFPSAVTHKARLYDLGEAEPIDRWIVELRAEVAVDPGPARRRDMTTRSDAVPSPTGANAGVSLYNALVRPLSFSIGDRRQLLLAPDGDLNRLPFEVLPIGDRRRLIDEYEVSYLAVGRDLRSFDLRTPDAAGPPFVLADPDFGNVEDPAQSSGARSADRDAVAAATRRSVEFDWGDYQFDRLPGSRAEGEEVGAMLGVEPAMGALASESRLKSCRSPRILHLATHGYFLANQEAEGERLQAMLDAQPWMEESLLAARRIAREQSVLDRFLQYGFWGAVLQTELFADLNDVEHEMAVVRRQVSGAGRLADLELENPLLRSGLALAGANLGLRGAVSLLTEDGLLTAEDVSGLDLADTDLVVLSACETGLGDVRTGEGVFGLRRAFVLAGAGTLIMSLWKVPDDLTRELMVNYYRLLLAGRGRAQALREAQLMIRVSDPEPYYWGAFICQGDPSPLGCGLEMSAKTEAIDSDLA